MPALMSANEASALSMHTTVPRLAKPRPIRATVTGIEIGLEAATLKTMEVFVMGMMAAACLRPAVFYPGTITKKPALSKYQVPR